MIKSANVRNGIRHRVNRPVWGGIKRMGLARCIDGPTCCLLFVHCNRKSGVVYFLPCCNCKSGSVASGLRENMIRCEMLLHEQIGRQFCRRHFKCISLTGKLYVSIQISLKFVRNGLIDNKSVLDQVMAWRRIGDKPLSEPTMINFITCSVTRPQWVNSVGT